MHHLSSLLPRFATSRNPLTPVSCTNEADPAACLALQDKCFPQTIAVCQTRASGLGLTVKVSDEAAFEYGDDVCGVMVQYPATDGRVLDYSVSSMAMCVLLFRHIMAPMYTAAATACAHAVCFRSQAACAC